MNVFSSLTNRIFLASVLLVLGSIAVPVYLVNIAVTAQTTAELERGLDEAALLVQESMSQRFENFVQVARAVADLPKLKAAVESDHPPTVVPIASDYERQSQADRYVVAGLDRVLASVGPLAPDAEALGTMIRPHLAGGESAWFWSYGGSVVRVAAIPLTIEPGPERLGTLLVGFQLDRATQRIKALTNSEVAILSGGEVVGGTLDRSLWAGLPAAAGKPGIFDWHAGREDYIGKAQPLGSSGEPVAVVLRSKTARLAFLTRLHRQIALAGVAAMTIATLFAYAIARTVTRPLRAVTATMREMASTGNLASAVPPVRRWDDEDARLLATTFRQLTTALDRFQREASQRERLSSLGRLSTVVAHEVRNPLMIIKTALRSLRQHATPQCHDVADSIDEEVNRINRVVTDVLDFARPVRVSVQPVDIVQICRDAAQAVQTGADDIPIAVDPAEPQAPIVTDAERVRGVLVNVLTNAQHAVRARGANAEAGPPIRIRTTRLPGRWRVEVKDRGVGIPAAELPRIFEPFFTTRRTGSGLGLAIARNVVEALGGSIAVESRSEAGTTVRIELPERSPQAAQNGAMQDAL